MPDSDSENNEQVMGLNPESDSESDEQGMGKNPEYVANFAKALEEIYNKNSNLDITPYRWAQIILSPPSDSQQLGQLVSRSINKNAEFMYLLKKELKKPEYELMLLPIVIGMGLILDAEIKRA